MVTLHEENLKLWQNASLEYKRYDYRLDGFSVVVDLGAYRGEWSDKIYELFGCQIILFEPTDNIHYARFGRKIQACAWLYDGEVQTNGLFYYTSMIHNNEPGLNKYRCVDVLQYLPAKVDLMKINIEGAEYDLIDYLLAADYLKNVDNLQVQFHITDKFDYELRYKLIRIALEETHELTWQCEFVWENWKRK